MINIWFLPYASRFGIWKTQGCVNLMVILKIIEDIWSKVNYDCQYVFDYVLIIIKMLNFIKRLNFKLSAKKLIFGNECNRIIA